MSSALVFPDTIGAELEAKVMAGTISVTGLPLTVIKSTPSHLIATIGDGSGRIGLAALKGTIALTGY